MAKMLEEMAEEAETEDEGEDDPFTDAIKRAFPGDWSPERVDALKEAIEICTSGYSGEEDDEDEALASIFGGGG